MALRSAATCAGSCRRRTSKTSCRTRSWTSGGPGASWTRSAGSHRGCSSSPAPGASTRGVVDVAVVRDLMGEDGNQVVEQLAWAAEVRAALDQMSAEQREAIELAYFGQ